MPFLFLLLRRLQFINLFIPVDRLMMIGNLIYVTAMPLGVQMTVSLWSSRE